MINITIIAVGKLKESYLKDGCNEYLKRLTPFAKTEVIEVSEERCSDNPSKSEINSVIEKEGERIIAKIKKGAVVIPLCIEGKEYDSVSFSKTIENEMLKGCSSLAFVIGGSFGLSKSVKDLGKTKLSFGKLTLPHQLARMILIEQIYRAFQIMNNGKYHK